MSGFLSRDDIAAALADENLSHFEDRILATVKPAVDFVRRQQLDEKVAAGTSKLGGRPDLPAGFYWPTRPPQQSGNAAPPSAGGLHERLRQDALGQEFPLAFVAQLNLGALSLEAGFDLDLPDSGMLYIFEDISIYGARNAYHVFRLEDGLDRLHRQSPPEDLVRLSDAKGETQPFADQLIPFADQPMTEVLEPYSILTVPFHWIQQAGEDSRRMYDFMQRSDRAYWPPSEVALGENAAPFGDRLGGWPSPMELDPEPPFRRDRSRSFTPGDDEVRLLFSWGAEYYQGTGLMHSNTEGDGAMNLMMSREDMLAGRFDRVNALYDCTSLW